MLSSTKPNSHSEVTNIKLKNTLTDYQKPNQIYVEQQHLNVQENKWRQTSRWIMYEECIEEGSNKWSHPFLPIVYLPAIKVLSLNLRKECIFTNLNAETFTELVHSIPIENECNSKLLKDILLLPHIHQSDMVDRKYRKHFENKLNVQHSASIMTGMVESLRHPFCAFIRLHKPSFFSELTELAFPTKFIAIYLRNSEDGVHSIEVGRALAALITDQDFLEYCYRHTDLDGFEMQVKRYLAKCCVLPPLWDHNTRIDPTTICDPHQYDELESLKQEEEDNIKFREANGLVRSGRLFGGLIQDIKRKAPHYVSDFNGLFSAQAISTILFMYFACLTAIITFGGLLAKATNNNLATVECLLGIFINGVIYALFSGQPLSLLAATGPILIYETIVYDLCTQLTWDYITFRVWIGIWLAMFLIILVATDASALMSYVTKFTEENFSLMVCAIYISTPFNYLLKLSETEVESNFLSNKTFVECINNGSDQAIFLMSVILIVATCGIAIFLTNLRNMPFFTYKCRVIIGQFAVSSSVLLMTIVDYLMGLNTEKLSVPEGFQPSKSDTRGWFIPLFHEKNPSWSCFAAIIPAIVAAILVFLGNQITILINCRKENKLKKGAGFHLDLFLISIMTIFNSLFGLPWFNVAVLLSMGHLQALKLETPPEAPGAKVKFVGFNEQRLTALFVSILLGATVFFTPLLKYIPMPVLYGVFLYLGITSVQKLEIIHRLALFVIPVKYMPDYPFLRRVKLKHVHIYTITQLSTFIVLWILKSFTQTALLFPVILVVMIWVRRSLESFLTQDELRMLDEYLPHATSKPRKTVYQFAMHPPESFMKKDDDKLTLSITIKTLYFLKK